MTMCNDSRKSLSYRNLNNRFVRAKFKIVLNIFGTYVFFPYICKVKPKRKEYEKVNFNPQHAAVDLRSRHVSPILEGRF